jgi:hypothetical protein
MIVPKAPDSIDGLTLWFDASDRNTINDGKVQNNQNVYKFIDKIGGVTLRNGSGVNGPTYSFNGVNGISAIHFPSYTLAYSGGLNNLSQKALTASGINQFNTATCSMFCIYKPTTNDYTATSNAKNILNIWSNDRITKNPLTTPGSGYANISFVTEPGYTAEQRDASVGSFYQAEPTYQLAGTLQVHLRLQSYSLNMFAFSLESPSNRGVVNISSVRLQTGIKKIGFLAENSECLEDMTLPASTKSPFLGPPRLPSPFSASSSFYENCFKYNSIISTTTGASSPVPNAWMTIGSYWHSNRNDSNFDNKYPFEGYFCEFLHYNRYLTDEETNSIREYLKLKWFQTSLGFKQIFTEPPIFSVPPVVSGFTISTTKNFTQQLKGDPICSDYSTTAISSSSVALGVNNYVSNKGKFYYSFLIQSPNDPYENYGIINADALDISDPIIDDDPEPFVVTATGNLTTVSNLMYPVESGWWNIRPYAVNIAGYGYGEVDTQFMLGMELRGIVRDKTTGIITISVSRLIPLGGNSLASYGFSYKALPPAYPDEQEFGSDYDPYWESGTVNVTVTGVGNSTGTGDLYNQTVSFAGGTYYYIRFWAVMSNGKKKYWTRRFKWGY